MVHFQGVTHSREATQRKILHQTSAKTATFPIYDSSGKSKRKTTNGKIRFNCMGISCFVFLLENLGSSQRKKSKQSEISQSNCSREIRKPIVFLNFKSFIFYTFRWIINYCFNGKYKSTNTNQYT